MLFGLAFFSKARSFLLFCGLFVVSLGGLMIATASEATVIRVARDLKDYWRTSYDILVRPPGTRSPIESKYGLVEANHLSGIWGGITYEQYDLIRSIPGVDIAAPIVMVGYLSAGVGGQEIEFPDEPGVYLVEERTVVNDGMTEQISPGSWKKTFFFDGSSTASSSDTGSPTKQFGNLVIDHPGRTFGGMVSYPFLLAAIDPEQEARLLGLDQAMVSGDYLNNSDSLDLELFTLGGANPGALGQDPRRMINLPILINAKQYIQLSYQLELKKVILPEGRLSLEEILTRGGGEYLEGLPIESLGFVETEGRRIFQNLIEAIAPELVEVNAPLGPNMLIGAAGLASTPGPIKYVESEAPVDFEGVILEIVRPDSDGENEGIDYRESKGIVQLDVIGVWDPKGIFDIERIPRPDDVHRVPLETYFPPTALLRYDEEGRSILPPTELSPTLNPNGYIQSPPLLLTTLEAARELVAENSISAIRIRVSDIRELSPSSQEKIETIAVEIARQTGLTVDIMVGSSPRRVFVDVPAVGYVEEQWIQKGVDLVYQKGIQKANLFIILALVAAGGIYALDILWVEILVRRPLIALQRALGWRPRDVFVMILRHIGLIAGAATLSSFAIMTLARALGHQPVPIRAVFWIPTSVFSLSIVGGGDSSMDGESIASDSRTPTCRCELQPRDSAVHYDFVGICPEGGLETPLEANFDQHPIGHIICIACPLSCCHMGRERDVGRDSAWGIHSGSYSGTAFRHHRDWIRPGGSCHSQWWNCKRHEPSARDRFNESGRVAKPACGKPLYRRGIRDGSHGWNRRNLPRCYFALCPLPFVLI